MSDLCSRTTSVALFSACALSTLARAQIHETRELTAVDGNASAQLGFATAVDGAWLVVGANRDDDRGANSGSAYLFEARTGALAMKFLAADGAAGDELGRSVALDGDLVVIGAPLDDDHGADSGAAYVFHRSSGTLVAKLTPADGAAGDRFGCAVAIEGHLVVVGACYDDDNGPDSGSLYLFDALTGVEVAKVTPNDGDPGDFFGESVDIDSGVIAVGAHGDEVNGPLSGSAYLFSATTHAQLAKLLPLDGGSNDFFGATIALDGGLVVVGAWSDSIFFDHSGSAYLFDASTGAQVRKIVPQDGHDRDHFGVSVAIDAGVIAIGADGDDDSAFDAGSAYLFDTAGVLIEKVLASDGAVFDGFGTSVAVGGGVVAVGAPYTDGHGSRSGSVYVVELTPGVGAVFCAGDGQGAACACGPGGALGSGCGNSTDAAGAMLAASGSASVIASDLQLVATRTTPLAAGIFFQGTARAGQGAGAQVGGGVLCVGGTSIRLEVVAANGAGVARTTAAVANVGHAVAGQTLYYQWWYRDVPGASCGAGFNFSNGLAVQWTP